MKAFNYLFALLWLFTATKINSESEATIKFDPSTIERGIMINFPVNDLPLMVVHRRTSEIESLEINYSDKRIAIEECPMCIPALRSIKHDYFVTWGYHPTSGCELIYVSSEADDWDCHKIQGIGGFVDKCSGSEYDLSGRKIFGPTSSPSELLLPKHKFEDGNLVIDPNDI